MSFAWWKRLAGTGGFMVAMVVLCAVIQEQYPFSHFPMYDKFPRETYYLYLTYADGRPFPVQKETGTDTTELKMKMDYPLKDLRVQRKKETGKTPKMAEVRAEKEAELGLHIIDWLVDNKIGVERKAQLGELHLHRVNIWVDEAGDIQVKEETIAKR